MATKIENLTPAFAIHPGELLKDELEAREIKQKDFAELTGLLPSQLNEIINGKRGINADYALVVGKALKMDPKIWMNLQTNYELDKAKINQKTSARIEAIDQWQMIQPQIPELYFRKQGYIQGDPLEDLDTVKKIYRIDHFEQLAGQYAKPRFASFRKHEKLMPEDINLVGWINLVAYEAAQTKVCPFDHANQGSVITKLRTIIWKNECTIERIKDTLGEAGIKFVMLSQPDKCAVDGFAFWSDGNPAIGLSLRFQRVDYLAFTLFHELGHIYLHLLNSSKAEFIDIDTENAQGKISKEEEEANAFAKNNLINPDSWRIYFASPARGQETEMIKLARKEKIHPAVIKGRLSHETGNYRIKTRFKNVIE